MKFCVLIWFDFLFLGKNEGEAETKGERGLTEASATPWPNIRIFERTWIMPTYEKSKLERLSGAKTLVVTQASSTNGKWKSHLLTQQRWPLTCSIMISQAATPVAFGCQSVNSTSITCECAMTRKTSRQSTLPAFFQEKALRTLSITRNFEVFQSVHICAIY